MRTTASCRSRGCSRSSVLGTSYHPGGLRLTRRLLDQVGVEEGRRMVDVASGLGTTALLAAGEYQAQVDGVDLSEANVTRARQTSLSTGMTEHAVFHLGDVEAVPWPDGCADAVVCECALCTFPDKVKAMDEMARLLRPGGRLGLTDVSADRARLPTELTGLDAARSAVFDGSLDYVLLVSEKPWA